MPWFMDIHRGQDGTTARDVENAHLQDVAIQDRYGVHYHKYFFNEQAGTIFCLVEAPNEEACHAVHEASHGLRSDEIIQVEPGLVDAFLGDGKASPTGTALRPDGSVDSAFRVILISRVANLPEIGSRMGDGAAMRLLQAHHEIVRRALERCSGREARDTGEGLMASFATASRALRCAAAIQQAAAEAAKGGDPSPRIGIGVSAGEPVEQNESLFGVSVNLAQRLCEHAEPEQILVSHGVRELALGKGFEFADRGSARLHGFEEPVRLYEMGRRADPAASVRPKKAESDASAEGAVPGRSPIKSRRKRLEALAHELRRRKVFRVAAVYVAVGFAVLQAAQLSFQPLGLPSWAYKLLLLFVILGFPIALVLAWAFEITPTGAVVAQRGGAADPAQSDPPGSG